MEWYRYCGGKKLRRGVTTGACAAAAAKAAALRLSGLPYREVTVYTPGGILLNFEVQDAGTKACGVYKDAGDDPDVTNGLLICAQVEPASSFSIEGGEGVGRVTLPGLEQPVGSPAINSGPRYMIEKAVTEVLGTKAKVTIFVPEGKKIAQKTCNPRLGIQGGISILGTTGIVEPMSESALIESIRLELSAQRAAGKEIILLTPGNYGETFAKETFGLTGGVLCSNFLGDAIDFAQYLGFRGFLLIAHAGKLVKTAGGIFATHSKMADARMEIFTAHSALAGAEQKCLQKLMTCISTDAAFDILETAGLLQQVTASLMEKIDFHLCQRGGQMETGAIMFTNKRGELGRTKYAGKLLEALGPVSHHSLREEKTDRM